MKKNNQKISQRRAFLAISKLSLLTMLKNPTSLFFNFAFPILLIMIFGMLGRGEQKFELGITNDSLKSGPIYENLVKIEALKISENKSEEEYQEMLNKGRIPAVLKISEIKTEDGKINYSFDIRTSKAAPNDAATIIAIIKGYSEAIDSGNRELMKLKTISMNQTEIEGRKLEQIDFILPGQLAYALSLSALMGIGISLVVLKKDLIIKRLFATPVKRKYILIGESTGKFTIGIIQFILIMSLGVALFGYSLANGFVTVINMFLLSIIGIVVFLLFGIFAASIAKTEDSITTIVNIIILPQLFLSGAFFPVEMLPQFVQPIAKILPMTLLNESYKTVAFEGDPLRATAPFVLGLFIWGVVMLLIDVKIFKWE